MKKIISISAIFLVYFSLVSLSAEDKIIALQNQIMALEKQKEKLVAEKQQLIANSDGLSYKIEELKIQSQTGLGIIGKYRLSRSLREAQKLAENIQNIEKSIYTIDNDLRSKRSLLVKEYDIQIETLMQKLNSRPENKKAILDKVKSYQAAKDRYTNAGKLESSGFSIPKIEIEQYDSPKEIREKADLINDLSRKASARIALLDSRISRLQGELRARKKLGEFADEMSFFGERYARGQVAVKAGESPTLGKEKENTQEVTTLAKANNSVDTEMNTSVGTRSQAENQPSDDLPVKAAEIPEVSVKNVAKGNRNVSSDFSAEQLYRIEKEIRSLEKQKRALKIELSTLSDKAESFRKKADEIEKTETRSSESRDSKTKTQDKEAKPRNRK